MTTAWLGESDKLSAESADLLLLVGLPTIAFADLRAVPIAFTGCGEADECLGELVSRRRSDEIFRVRSTHRSSDDPALSGCAGDAQCSHGLAMASTIENGAIATRAAEFLLRWCSLCRTQNMVSKLLPVCSRRRSCLVYKSLT